MCAICARQRLVVPERLVVSVSESTPTKTESRHSVAPPIQPDQEWANAWTHGLSAALWVGLAVWLVQQAAHLSTGLGIACGAYTATVIGTFVFSTLSHVFLKQPKLDYFRAWDQAMIYLMIIGTYTPITYQYAPDGYRTILLIAMWVPAIWGWYNKAIRQYRIHSISTVTYLLLGWLPAVPLYGQVPLELGLAMLGGGVVYSVGVIFLINDRKVRYFHTVWHLMVLAASLTHLWGISEYVVAIPV